MGRRLETLFVVLMLVISASVGLGQINTPSLRLLLSEVQPGTMSSEHYCTLVFSDHRFHSERASRKMGKDHTRSVFEGQLSDTDWNALDEILENPEFRDLSVPQDVTPLIVEDAHPISMSIWRGAHYQNLEFLNSKSRKPYDSKLKPLLGWWKALRSGHNQESSAAPDPKCSLDSTHAIFTQ